LNIFQACIFDFFLFDFNKNNDGTDLDLGTLISSDKDSQQVNTPVVDKNSNQTIQDFEIWY